MLWKVGGVKNPGSHAIRVPLCAITSCYGFERSVPNLASCEHQAGSTTAHGSCLILEWPAGRLQGCILRIYACSVHPSKVENRKSIQTLDSTNGGRGERVREGKQRSEHLGQQAYCMDCMEYSTFSLEKCGRMLRPACLGLYGVQHMLTEAPDGSRSCNELAVRRFGDSFVECACSQTTSARQPLLAVDGWQGQAEFFFSKKAGAAYFSTIQQATRTSTPS